MFPERYEKQTKYDQIGKNFFKRFATVAILGSGLYNISVSK